jgi:porphobilinogen synthase
MRYHPTLRDFVRETHLSINDLVLPLFIRHGVNEKRPIASMPGHFQWSVDRLQEEIEEIITLGIKSVILFGIPENKDGMGSDSYSDDGVIQQAIRLIKSVAPKLLVISDICFCQYTDHGHCGVAKECEGVLDMDNDRTLELLAKQVVSHAKAGTDIVAPAGMVDGAVETIRKALDEAQFFHLPILSYAVKYRSAMYGPFGQAAEGAAKIGDRSSYQMDPANGREALREVMADIKEGVDLLMVKPAHTYLDVIFRVKQQYPYIPLFAYHVSGEYAMLKAAFANRWLDEQRTILEVVTSIKRAGADVVITYFAKDLAIFLNEGTSFQEPNDLGDVLLSNSNSNEARRRTRLL